MTRRSATIKDVALHAGVSTATVSRVLNDDNRVTAETRDRVIASVAHLGYKVNSVARSLKTRATKTIGILAPDLAGDFFMYIAESLDRELSARGYSLVVCSSRNSVEEESGRLHHLAERLVDGVVVIPVSNRGAHFSQLRDRNIPIVFLDRFVDDFRADAVLVDNEQGAYEATKGLIGDGHRRIGFLGGKPEISTSRERYSGFEKAMLEAGLAIEPDFVRIGLPTLPFGYRSMEEMMKLPGSPDAWFIVNGFVHMGATSYLFSRGGERAQRIAFASFDEMPYAPLMRFSRYSVQQPIAELGRTAAGLIIERISGAGGPDPRIIRLKTRVIHHTLGPLTM
ncbi:MAG: LacI family DNA-binding transcriptional regulator [Rectinemataceae bacterium]